MQRPLTVHVCVYFAPVPDRSNMSTAILPMAEEFGWEKVKGVAPAASLDCV